MSEIENATYEEQQERTPFVVDDDAKAEWCLQQIKNCQEDIQKWEEHYDRQKEQMTKSSRDSIEYFTGLLGMYLTRQINDGVAKQTKVQSSYSLPSGKLLLKRQAPEFKVDDEKLLAWAKEHCPEFVKVITEEKAMWGEIKKHCITLGSNVVSEDGEPVEGVVAVPRPDVFKVEVK